MKSTKAFQDTIERYLEKMAQGDHLFADKLNNPNKSIEGCVNFILSEVQKSEINGFTDEEVYSMAVHYYVEEGITEHGPVQCQVVVNHQVELTPEEIAEMRQQAKERVLADEISRLRNTGKKPLPSVSTPAQEEQLLFAFD